MRGTRKFMALMGLLFVLLFVLQIQLPKQFVWNPTFLHSDKQPFGCYVFDSVLTQSMPKGYQVTRQTFMQLNLAHPDERIGVLALMDQPNFTDIDVSQLLDIAKRGGKVMLVYNRCYGTNLEDTLHITMGNYGSFSADYLMRSISNGNERYDILCWTAHDKVYPANQYRVYSDLIGSRIFVDSKKKATVLVRNTDDPRDTLAISIPYGKGRIFVASTPLLFTNYGMLCGQTSEYIFRMMSQMADLPVYRMEIYKNMDATEGNQSPLREFLRRPALRWAIYLAMLGVILFMLFTARRRQRVIPVMAPPVNKSLEFIQLIGTLYYQRKDHADLVRKKFLFFAEETRRKIGVDIADVNSDGSEYQLLAVKLGMQPTEVEHILREVRLVVHSDASISAAQMRKMIDAIDEMQRKL